MKALTYLERGRFAVTEKPKPVVTDPRDAVVRVTLGSICTSDLHIKHGSVPPDQRPGPGWGRAGAQCRAQRPACRRSGIEPEGAANHGAALRFT